jgi:hypothetical protein
MSNVLSEEKRQQVIALGKLGWPLRRIEQATGVRRTEAYLSVTPDRFLKQISTLSPDDNPKRTSPKNGDSEQSIAASLALLGLVEYLHEGYRGTQVPYPSLPVIR